MLIKRNFIKGTMPPADTGTIELGILLIAEGAEDEQQLSLLKKYGVKAVQSPVPIAGLKRSVCHENRLLEINRTAAA